MRTNTTLKTKAMSILLALVMLLGMLPISAFAAETEDYITVFNKLVYAGQYFAGGSGAVDSVALADNYLHYEGDGKITLKNFVHSDTSVRHAILTDNKDVSLTLIGESELTILNGYAFVVVNNGKLQISGDGSLKGNGTISCNGFELSEGTVTVDGVTSEGDIGISGGELTLTLWSLKAIGNYDISITGGKVTVSGNRYAIFATGDNGTVSIAGGEVELTAVVSGSGGDKAIFANTVTIDENMQILAGSSAADAAVVGSYNDEMYVKITLKKDLIITGGTDYTYENGVLDIKAAGTYEIKNVDPTTATDDIIKVSAPEGSTVNITLSGVNIDVSNTGDATAGTDGLCAFDIGANCTTNITLKDETTNILKSGAHMAGLQNKTYPLTIFCEHREEENHECKPDCGAIEVYGGRTAAGIGGRGGWEEDRTDGSNITINGGNVTATSEQNGAGIGGGSYGNGSNITISGGTVTATSAGDGAGIGGGSYGNGSNITISGGTVTATSEWHGAGIGGGGFNGNGSNITISGGTVTATSTRGVGIGGGYNGSADSIKIAPAANTEIEVNTGANVSAAEELTYAFAEEMDITELVSQNAYFYSEAVVHNLTVTTASGVTTGYTTLTDAVAAAQAAEGSTLKLMNDITITSAQDVSSGRFTLDLNGHTLLNESGITLWIGTAAEITIMDSGTGGTIRSNDSSGDAVLNRGKLTVESGRIAGAHTALASDGTSLTVNGGIFEGGAYAVYITGGTAEINDGTFNGTVWGFCDYTINGGSFTANYIGINKAGGVLTINGGTFDVQLFRILNGEISVTDGAFSIDPSDYVPVGYAASYDSTIGYYTVALCTDHSWNDGVCTLCGTVCEHTYGEATCEAPATCSVCGATTGDALGHKDDNTDHTCDRGCGKTNMGTHADSATDTDHLCDYGCGATLENCTDAVNDNNHSCDVCGNADVSTHTYGDASCEAPATCSECGATTGDALGHKDENTDHTCDRGCGKTDMGTHADSATDTDHLCDYGCGATLENCTDAVNDNNHSCDVCGNADVSTHTYGDASCEAPATCSECGATTGDALGHKDDNTDHTCDRGCGKTDMGTHGDTDKDHECDYGCTVAIGTCADSDKDHDCDYGCNKTFGTHAQATGKHTCDYCDAVMSSCKDDDENHICDICGAELTHDYSTEWKSDGTNHWHECSCGAKADEAAHNGGTATCTVKAACSACGVAYGELAAHTYGTEWKSDGTNHWHECSCGAKADEAAHNGGTASCTDKAVCSACGVAYGELAAHTYGTEWKSDGTNHWHECTCGAKVDEATHNGGTATCTDKAKCVVCVVEYGELAAHTYGTEWKSDGTNHWHECTCGAKVDEAAHSGGTATCTDKAVCSVCGVAYGELAAHTYGTEWKSDGTNHWHECSCGAKADEAAHNGGTATCTDKAACSACGVAYGELAAHTYENGKCTVCEAVDPDYVPESSSPQTGDNSNMALRVALLFISSGAVITLTVYDRKRRNAVNNR